jgi:hypothetical protein
MSKYILLFIIGSSFLTNHSYAAIITWGAVQDTTSNAANDVVDGGAVVLALNGQSQGNNSSLRPGPVTLDGVLFESRDFNNFLGRIAIDDPAALALPAGTTTGDADYDIFLNHVAFVNTSNAVNAANTGLSGTDNNSVYPITGLTANTDYLIQVWYTDERNNGTRTATYGDNEGNSVNVPAQGANGLGSFVVGQFTADSTMQDLRIGITGSPNGHVTGLLVRATAVPEPSSFFAMALVAGGLVFVQRQKREKTARATPSSDA